MPFCHAESFVSRHGHQEVPVPGRLANRERLACFHAASSSFPSMTGGMSHSAALISGRARQGALARMVEVCANRNAVLIATHIVRLFLYISLIMRAFHLTTTEDVLHRQLVWNYRHHPGNDGTLLLKRSAKLCYYGSIIPHKKWTFPWHPHRRSAVVSRSRSVPCWERALLCRKC